MNLRWSWRVNLIGGLLILGMLRMSWWQWERHQWKLGLIADLRSRLELPIVPLKDLAAGSSQAWDKHIFKRVSLSGSYDFSKEMLLRNRKYGTSMGFHVLTPLKLDDSELYVLVDRGFLPQSKAEPAERVRYQAPEHAVLVGLIKESNSKKFMAPADPASGGENPWVDRWLRVDIPSIQRQLPYPVLPIFLEIVQTDDTKAVEQSIVDQKASGRDEMFFLGAETALGSLSSEAIGGRHYPIPVFDTVLPPGRHLGYVFEWAFLALLTALICLILQLERPTTKASSPA